MNVRKRLVPFFAAGAVLATVAVGVQGADTNQAVNSAIDPQADAWLHRTGDFLSQAPFFSVTAEVWQDVTLPSGARAQAGRTVELQVRRPDRFHAEVHSTRRNREMFYDGKNFTLLNRAGNFYGSFAAPANIDDALDTACDKFGITLPLEDLIVSNPYESASRHINTGMLLGPVTVLDVPCEHLVFTQDKIDWQIWIEQGATPVPRKIVITYKDEEGSPQYTAILSHWDFQTKLSDFVFNFEAPPGARKINVAEIKAKIQEQQNKGK